LKCFYGILIIGGGENNRSINGYLLKNTETDTIGKLNVKKDQIRSILKKTKPLKGDSRLLLSMNLAGPIPSQYFAEYVRNTKHTIKS